MQHSTNSSAKQKHPNARALPNASIPLMHPIEAPTKGQGNGKTAAQKASTKQNMVMKSQTDEQKVLAWKKTVVTELLAAEGLRFRLDSLEVAAECCAHLGEMQDKLKEFYTAVTSKQVSQQLLDARSIIEEASSCRDELMKKWIPLGRSLERSQNQKKKKE